MDAFEGKKKSVQYFHVIIAKLVIQRLEILENGQQRVRTILAIIFPDKCLRALPSSFRFSSQTRPMF